MATDEVAGYLQKNGEKMKVFILLGTSVLLLTTSCSSVKEGFESAECNNTEATGYRTIVEGETTREYIVKIPDSYVFIKTDL